MASIRRALGQGVTIGVDPHPGSHTAAALDPMGGHIGTIEVPNGEEAGRQLLEWAGQFPHRRWAIEGAGNRFVRCVVTALLDAHEEVYSIPPSMTSQYRSRRGVKKDDVIDAANAARALQANPGLARYVPGEHEAHVKAVSRSYHRLSTELKRLKMMQKAAEDAIVIKGLQAAIVGLGEAVDALRQELKTITEALSPELLERQGIGPVVAGTILAEVGDVARFRNRDALASYGGAAPMPWSSGKRKIYRVNPGGNRRLNWATHMIVRTRLRLDERTRAFRDRKLAQGMTERAILRSLKTYVLREIYAVLTDAPRHSCLPAQASLAA